MEQDIAMSSVAPIASFSTPAFHVAMAGGFGPDTVSHRFHHALRGVAGRQCGGGHPAACDRYATV